MHLQYCMVNIILFQVVNLQAELSYLQAHLTTLELPTPPPPAPPAQSSLLATPPLSISDLPATSSMPATYDLSSLFDPMVQQSFGTTTTLMQQQQPPRQMDPRQLPGGSTRGPTGEMLQPAIGGGDLQELARELLQRQGSTDLSCTDPNAALPPHSR